MSKFTGKDKPYTNVQKPSTAIQNPSLKLGWCSRIVISYVFCLQPHEKVEDLCYKVRSQWKLYHSESKPNVSIDEEMKNQDKEKGETSTVNYWENAFKAFDIKIPSQIAKKQGIDAYWRGAIKIDFVQLKILSCLV